MTDIELGDFYDNLTVYELAIMEWEKGNRERAKAILRVLIEHVESRGCPQSRIMILEKSRAQLILMSQCPATTARIKKREKAHKTENIFQTKWPVGLPLVNQIAAVVVYAVLVFFCVAVLGEAPGIVISI